MTEELVSIVTPVFNAEKYIADTIQSVLNQTYENIELLLVDDCSRDLSREIIESLAINDSRIRYIRLQENSGAAVARNTGIKNAKGRYIAFIDSDDMWKADKLKKQLTFMQENDYPFTYTSYETITEEGHLKKGTVNVPEKISYTGLLKNTAIACSTVLIDREIIGDFRMPLVRKGQDTATWLLLLRNIPYAYGLNEVLTSYRKVPGSISSNKVDALKRTWNTYYRLEKLPFPKAAYYFSWYVWNALRKRI
ncbi:glycosyl transferase [Jeotgalibaca sp. PTS2502]|uniref:glycosyltransferase family 2 protein n=1 Tax=Jeotgalibaca sp. PTS2502 TaxID=1903686 RepID=UPI000973CE30|nr:glycosyltransferase family 2 protein [Jeotgalibaca sp. PTS2502]APZ49225.1 glycosyl transferase [Jeotgalibaca sp. PTS2502]